MNPNELRSILSLLSMISKDPNMLPLLKKLRSRGELWVPGLSGSGLIPLHSAVHAHTCSRLLLQRQGPDAMHCYADQDTTDAS